MPPIEQRTIEMEVRRGGVLAARFLAMGSPCEILLATTDEALAARSARLGAGEAWRIERRFSRYRADSVVAALNASGGRAVAIDAETQRLFDYAAHCHELSGGLFDITSGVLRHAWKFDGSDGVPDPEHVRVLRARVGFERLQRGTGAVTVPEGMEIDLGGIAKEYAVDRALEVIDAADRAQPPTLVNFGGDLRANRSMHAAPWQVAVEPTDRGAAPALVLELGSGALATSGDAHRYVERGGRRYGHILDPRTGWPVANAPRSVTVAAPTCVEAGTLCTIAVLMGARAEAFLEDFDAAHWIQR